jgi:hypothetical protein
MMDMLTDLDDLFHIVFIKHDITLCPMNIYNYKLLNYN